MPPYQNTPEATRRELGKLGMEVAPDFIDNECLTRFTDGAISWMESRAADAKNGVVLYDGDPDRTIQEAVGWLLKSD